MVDPLSIFVPANRVRLLSIAALLVAAIAAVDWVTEPYLSVGFLYLFPIVIVSGYLSRKRIVAVALVCAVLQEAFSNLPKREAVVRLLFNSAGFLGVGLFISEVTRNRRIVLRHVDELEEEAKLRKDAEEQLQSLVESSPAAIVTIDLSGKILLANEAAQQLLAPGQPSLRDQTVTSYLPTLQTVLQTHPSRIFRTTLQCMGKRSTGEAFLAGIWFSTYTTISGPRLAAIIVDLSEDLRNREDLSLDNLLKNTRILMSAVAHEIRNLCGAVLIVHKNLSRLPALENNEDFQALGTLIHSLEKMSALELRPFPQSASAVDLTSVLEELRVLIDTEYYEAGMEVRWNIEQTLPLVWADRYGLLQVFLNLARNSRRALQSAATRQLSVTVFQDGSTVRVCFEDTGPGVQAPENLFRPFQPGADSAGLGLYVSRAIMRSFRGELLYQPRSQGCAFAAILPTLPPGESANA